MMPAFSWALCMDVLRLGKPRLSALVLLTAGAGLALAPGPFALGKGVAVLLGSACAVWAANALNCYLERDIDAAMRRTHKRPLPAGKMPAGLALAAGWLGLVLALGILAFGVNVQAAALGALGFGSYVAWYTPMKQRSWLSVWVGALPGAVPPLMGYVAVAEGMPVVIDRLGLWLFALLFSWQLPHFIAISLYLADDYRRGGVRVLAHALADVWVRRVLVASNGLFALVVMWPWLQDWFAAPWDHLFWLVAAIAFAYGLPALWAPSLTKFSRKFFFSTLLSLPVVLGVAVWLGS